MTARLIYRDADGRELTTSNLDVSFKKGRPCAPVPPDAFELHQQGRKAGAEEDYDRALDLLERAHQLAPGWAYPLYDIAFTYLMKNDTARAEEYYMRVDLMEPRGFFTTKTFLDGLKRERSGALPAGFCGAFSSIELIDDKASKRALLESIVEKFPNYPPAWKELSVLLSDDDARLNAMARGLEHNPDGDTRGLLLINTALILERRGRRDEAIQILGDLALDPESTIFTELTAKLAIHRILPEV